MVSRRGTQRIHRNPGGAVQNHAEEIVRPPLCRELANLAAEISRSAANATGNHFDQPMALGVPVPVLWKILCALKPLSLDRQWFVVPAALLIAARGIWVYMLQTKLASCFTMIHVLVPSLLILQVNLACTHTLHQPPRLELLVRHLQLGPDANLDCLAKLPRRNSQYKRLSKGLLAAAITMEHLQLLMITLCDRFKVLLDTN